MCRHRLPDLVAALGADSAERPAGPPADRLPHADDMTSAPEEEPLGTSGFPLVPRG